MFSISLRHKQTNEIIESKKAFWAVQTFAFGQRAKRILTIDIPREGSYEVLFKHPEALKVKYSNLLFSDKTPLPTDSIKVVITEKFGVFPISS